MMLWLVISLCCVATMRADREPRTNSHSSFDGHLSNNSPLHSFPNLLYKSGPSPKPPMSYSESQLKYLRSIFKLGGMQHTAFSRLLHGASVPDTSKLSELNVASVLNRLHSDHDFADRFKASFLEHASRKQQGIEPEFQSDILNCSTDFNAFLKPLTDELLYILCPLICEDLIGNCFICAIFRPAEEDLSDWALDMIDATAKIPEGLLEGKLHWPGAYEYCEEVDVVYNNSVTMETRAFSGKYCRVDFTPREPLVEDLGNLTLSLQIGLCVPSTCQSADLPMVIESDTLLALILQGLLEWDITDVYCGRELDFSNDQSVHAALGVLAALLLLVIIGTIWDGCFRRKWIEKKIRRLPHHITAGDNQSPNGSAIAGNGNVEHKNGESLSVIDKPLSDTVLQDEHALKLGCVERMEILLNGFSAYSNIARICTKPDKNNFIPELNGIRALSYGLLLIGHVVLFGPVYNECWVTGNLLGALIRLPKDWIIQIVINFSLNSDSFLFLSGTLTAYWWLIQHDGKRRVTCGGVAYYIIHRYWRLMPNLMLCLMFYTTCIPYINDGPLFPRAIQDSLNCRENWWPNLLMVNNYVNTDKTCLTWMWYPAVLFQLHIVTLVVLIPLIMKPLIGYLMMAAMFIAHIGAAAGILSNTYDDLEQWYWQYLVTPYGRAGPYVIGLACGALLHCHRTRRFKMPTLLHLAGWLASLSLLLGVIFATHDQYKEGGVPWDKSKTVAHELLSRNAWALCLFWIVFACHTGHGGIISSILSYNLWRPLSRLIYVTLPLHAVLIFNFCYSRYTLLYISVFHLLYDVFSHYWTTIGVGLVVACVFHYPLSVGIERAILAKDKLQWIRSGRHPEDMLTPTQKANGVAWATSYPDTENAFTNNGYTETVISPEKKPDSLKLTRFSKLDAGTDN